MNTLLNESHDYTSTRGPINLFSLTNWTRSKSVNMCDIIHTFTDRRLGLCCTEKKLLVYPWYKIRDLLYESRYKSSSNGMELFSALGKLTQPAILATINWTASRPADHRCFSSTYKEILSASSMINLLRWFEFTRCRTGNHVDEAHHA